MSVEAVFMKGGNLRRVCEVTLSDGKVLRVEPYAIYTATTKRRHFMWYLLISNDLEEEGGWRHPEAASVSAAKLTETMFDTRTDYDPFDRFKFPVMHYSIPTHDGRQRWMDAQYKNKQDLINRPL
jgi:hypothetical protein